MTISGTWACQASRTAGCRLAVAVPDVVRTAAGAPDPLASPSARKAAVRSSTRTCSRSRPMRSASKHSYASGALRAPGASPTSRTPRVINPSMITRAHAVALPTGLLPSLHETSLPEPLDLLVRPVSAQRGIVDGRIAHPDHPIDRGQRLDDHIV